jgi:hypothetical protein
MKYCLTAHIFYLGTAKQTHLIELIPPPDKVIIKQLVEQTSSNIQQLLLKTRFFMTIVGIATRYRLDVLGSNPDGRGRFSAPVQTVPEAHPAPYTMGAESLSRRQNGCGVMLTTHLRLAPSGPSLSVLG